MLDFNPNQQTFPDGLAAVSVPEAIVPHVESRAYWDNQTVEVQFQAARNTQPDWGQYKLRWELNKAGGIECIGVGKLGVSDSPIASARVPMPRVQSSRTIPLTLRLINAAGYELVNHSKELLVLPSHAAQARYNDAIAVMTLAGTEAGIVRQLNYSVEDSLSSCTQVVVTNAPNAEILGWVRDGGKLLFVSEGENPAFWQYSRGGTSEDNWITSTSWLRPEVYPNLKIDNPLKWSFQHVMPQNCIGGLPQEDQRVKSDFLAGRISGWVQRPQIHTVQFGYGCGTVIMTTYTLLESLRFGEPDPVGVVMLNDLIAYLVSDLCRPTLRY